MAAQDSTIKTTIVKKPLVVIKKESIFKPNRTIFLNTSLKRPITKYVAAKSGKKTCLAVLDEAQSGETLITSEKKTEEETSKPNNVTEGLSMSTDISSMIKSIPFHDYCKYSPGYVPYNKRCLKHGELPEHSAEGLLTEGLTFKSGEEFNDYCVKNAKVWNFDYRRSDSQNLKEHANYNPRRPSYLQYNCVFRKTCERYKAKGIRKRRSVKVKCPAGVTLKCGVGKDVFKAENVCHHHSHEISAELFKQIPQGYRLPQEIKDEIRDLALFNVDWMMANRYIEAKLPGRNLKSFISNIFFTTKKNKQSKDTMSPERIKEMLAKVKYLKENFAAPVSTTSRENKYNKVADKKQKVIKNDLNPKPKKKGKKSNHVSVEDFELQNSAFEAQTERWVETVLNEANNNDGDDNFHQENQELSTEVSTSESSDIKTIRTYHGPSVVVQREPTLLTEQSLSLKKDYKIGGITIQTEETVDESGVATVVLLGVEKGFETSEVINELSKLKSSIIPKQEQDSLNDDKQIEDVRNVLKVPRRVPMPVDPYQAKIRCEKRHDPLPEYKAEGLIKVGDTFSSIVEFARYASEHALKWLFYYQIHDSRNVKTSDRYNCKKKTWYNFSCRFNKGRYKSQSTGLRKVKQKTIQCPGALSMVCEAGETEFKVTYVCHHHSHPLSAEVFSQEAHGYRLSPELKDEIRDLLWFRCDTRLLRQYLLDKTGFDLKRTVINILSKMRRDRLQLYVPPEREKEILDKIQEIKQKFSIPKRAPPRKKLKLEEEEYMCSESDSDEASGSRVEARLNNILHDQALIQSVRELQETTGCEIQIAPWREMHDGGVSHLQAGLEDSQNNELDDYNDNDNQIEIDGEQYAVDDNAYVTQSNEKGENVVYLHQIEPTPEASTSYQDITNDVYQAPPTGNTDGTSNYSEEIFIDTQDENINYAEEVIQTTEQELENNGITDGRQVMYDITTDYEQRYREGTYLQCRNVGVQVDLEIIQLEGEFEHLEKLESSMLKSLFSSEKSHQKTMTVSTRGRPKDVLEEFIINRYNVEFYFNVGGVVTCLENIALNMNLSVFDLLKKLYQGEAVFKMSVGRSGSQARKTVQLKYLPLTINFPFEKFKCTNVLQEYKTICSKYTDMAIKLENTIASISTDLNAKNERLEMLVSQNEELIKEKESYTDTSHAMKDQLLKQSQLDLAKAQAENQMLLQKISELEGLQLASRLKDAEILKQLLENQNITHHQDPQMLGNLSEPMFLNELECQQGLNSKPEDSISNDKITMLEENPQSNMIEKIKTLEEKVKISDDDIKRYKETIKTLESSNLNDNQALHAKIKSLEDELRSLQTEFDKMSNSESECRDLRKKIIELEKEKASEKNKFVGEIKSLYNMTTSLNDQLTVEKLKNYQSS